MCHFTLTVSPSKRGHYRRSTAMCAGQWLPCWTHSLGHSFSSFLLSSTPKLSLYCGRFSCITYKHPSIVFKTSAKALFSLLVSKMKSCSLPITVWDGSRTFTSHHHESPWSRQRWLGLFASVLVHLNCFNKILWNEWLTNHRHLFLPVMEIQCLRSSAAWSGLSSFQVVNSWLLLVSSHVETNS